jgi:hypothetical protein
LTVPLPAELPPTEHVSARILFDLDALAWLQRGKSGCGEEALTFGALLTKRGEQAGEGEDTRHKAVTHHSNHDVIHRNAGSYEHGEETMWLVRIAITATDHALRGQRQL